MDVEKQGNLEKRNTRIIHTVIKKIEAVCPGSVALIGIGGSFYSGDIHEKSDLDLLIIANDDKANLLSAGFILDGVGFDIYCSGWDSLEKMAEYTDPYCGKLFDLKLVYVLDKASSDRYHFLQERLADKLNSPLSTADIEKAEEFLRKAEQEYINIMISDDISTCRFSSATLLYYIEFSIYMLNKKYVKLGIKRIPQEIGEMPILPERFCQYHDMIVRAESVPEIKMSCTKIIKTTLKCFKELNPKNTTKKELTAQVLTGTYEEIYSNWREKMYHSIDIDNSYLSFSTIASCQNFYNEMSENYSVENINVIKDYNPSDLKLTAALFDKAMNEYLKLYDQYKVDVVNYKTIEDFEKNYLL